MNDLLLCEAFEKPKSRVVSRKVTVSNANGEFHCQTDYIFNENIAITEEFSVTD